MSALVGIGAPTLSGAALSLLLIVFGLASIEKILTLRARSASWHPILLVSRRRRKFAVALMIGGLAADLFAIVTLLLAPSVAWIVGTPVLAVYTLAGIGANHDHAGCQCLWRFLNSSTQTGMTVRNLSLMAMFLPLAANAPAHSTASALWTFVLLAILAGVMRFVDWLAMFFRSQTSGAI